MNAVIGVMIFQGLLFLAVIITIIVLIIKRIDEKKNERFEKRDN